MKNLADELSPFFPPTLRPRIPAPPTATETRETLLRFATSDMDADSWSGLRTRRTVCFRTEMFHGFFFFFNVVKIMFTWKYVGTKV